MPGRDLFAAETAPAKTGRNLFAEAAEPAKPSAFAQYVSRAGPLERGAVGLGEAALKFGTGMIASPLNSFYNAFQEARERPTGAPVPSYQPKTPEGQMIAGGVDRAIQSTGLPSAIESGLDLKNPNPAVRATGNLIAGAVGVLPGFQELRALKGASVAIPTRAAIKTASQAAYKGAEASGEIVPQTSLAGFTSDAEALLAKEGMDAALHPKTMAGLNRLYEEATRPGIDGHSAMGAETIRKVLSNAETEALSASKPGAVSSDARLAGQLVDKFDDFMDEQLPQSGSKYGDARALWNIQRKAQDIETVFERAKNQAGQYSTSGLENSLRSQFKQLADNPRRFASFSPDEKAAILTVVRGTNTQNALRYLGKLAVRGPVSGMAAMGGEALLPGAGLAMAITGEGAKAAATAMRRASADRISELIRSKATPYVASAPPNVQPRPQLGYLPAFSLTEQERRRNALPGAP